MTRWLLGIGLVLTALGLGGLATGAASTAQQACVILAIAGTITAAISPLLMDGLVFRSLSAPRVLQLIPGARVRMLLGAALVQLALAAFISGVITTMLAISAPAVAATTIAYATMFAAVYATFTLQFIGSYLLCRFRLGGLWLLTWSLWVRLIAAVIQDPHLRGVLGTASGLGAIVALCVVVWLAFAVHYLSARLIPAADWSNVGMGAQRLPRSAPQSPHGSPRHTYSHRQAIQNMLSGGSRQRRSLLMVAVPLVLILLLSVVGRSHLPRDVGYGLLELISMMAGPLTGSIAGVMAQRAKPLWLQSGLGRRELFAVLEARSWRVVLVTWMACAALAIGWLMLFPGARWWSAWSAGAVLTPVVSGALFTYAQLQFVRGRALADSLLLALAIGLWMIEFFGVVVGAGLPFVASLLGAQLVLVPLLRWLALRRWERIDWLVHRGLLNVGALR